MVTALFMRSPCVSGNAERVSAAMRNKVSSPMRRTMTAVFHATAVHEEGADLLLDAVLFVARHETRGR